MSVPSLSTADFNEEGFFMHTRAIERLALAIQQLGGSFGDNNAGQGAEPTTLGLAPGIFNPAKVEVGGDGNIVSIGAGTGFSGLPSAYIRDAGYTLSTYISGIGASYPFENFTGSFVYQNGFSGLSFSGTGSSSCITGFDPLKTYLVTLTFPMLWDASSAGPGYNAAFSSSRVIRNSSGSIVHSQGNFASGTDNSPYNFSAASWTTDSGQFILTGETSIYCTIILNSDGQYTYRMYRPNMTFIQLD